LGGLRHTVSILVLVLVSGFGTARAEELRGVALVIGQADYETLGDLGNPLNDARAMDELLGGLGFEVSRVLDRGGDRLRRAIADFVEDAEDADVALVYYAGHAVEAGGQNFLVPVDADLTTGNSLIAVSEIVDELARIVPVTILLLDACRTEAFPDGSMVLLPGSATPVAVAPTGLGEMRGPTPMLADVPPESLGMVIGFASAPGQAALDGPAGGHSPYAAALLKHFSAGGYAFGDLMTLVTEEVYLRTGAKQVPWTNSSLRRVLSFGTPVETISGDEALIRDGRRQLLLSIASTPADIRRQVEAAAASADVPMDTLYGLLDVLGAEAPSDPVELDRLLQTQTETLRKVMTERAALTSTDPEILRLAELAQRAMDEGALGASLSFWEAAKARYGAISASLDATEALLQARRLEGGALLAQTALTYGLSGDFLTAAENFRLAFLEVERWDDGVALNYKSSEAEAVYLHGVQAGDNSALRAAAALFGEALALAPEASPQWANLQREIGNSFAQLASRDGSDASIDAAVAGYEAALGVFTRESAPLEWAKVQTRRAAALSIRGEREAHGETLAAAIDAYHAALDILSPAIAPYEWALAQNNLGNTLMVLGGRRADPDLLIASTEAFRAALTQSSPETHPFDWAMTQVNLGAALLLLGTRSNDRELLAGAVEALTAALAYLPRERVPLQWARAHGNLGAALLRAGELDGDVALIEQAALAFEAALGEFTPERALLDWSTATTNLGNALTFLARAGGDTQRLADAAAAYRATAAVLAPETAPLQWAQAHNNLGATLLLLGERGGGLPVLAEALDALDLALTVWTRAAVPLDWAMAQRNIGHVLVSMAQLDDDPTLLPRAAAAYRNAAGEMTRERAPADWASLQFRLGSILLELALRDPAPERFAEAIAAYDAALTVYSRADTPLVWADVTSERGWALASSGYFANDLPRMRDGRAAIEAAWQIGREAGIGELDAHFAQRLAIIDDALAALTPP
jgi:uncharacterized caspase-like protein